MAFAITMGRVIPLFVLVLADIAFIQTAVVAQVVTVTVRLDKTNLTAGETTTLHAHSQIVADRRAGTDRIFSWYVDVLNSNGQVAAMQPGDLVKISSDQDPRTSSAGIPDGPHRRGIYDTYLNLSGAGRDTPVELFSVPVKALSRGIATFSVVAGTGATDHFADFVVAPLGGGIPLLGGDYSAASVSLVVEDSVQAPSLRISLFVSPAVPGNQVILSFLPVSGRNHFIEFRDSLSAGSWQVLPAGPHNLGSTKDTVTASSRFYRLRLE